MIEEDIADLNKRVEAIEAKFNNLVNSLAAGFGSEQAADIEIVKARNAQLEQTLAAFRERASENNSLLVELAQILGIRSGGITKEALIRAAKKARSGK